MVIFDLVIVFTILLSVLIGFFRGFVRETLSLLSLVIAFWVGYKFASPASFMLEEYISQDTIRIIVSFAILFVIVLIITSIISYLLHSMFSAIGITGVDRFLGAVFGFARGCLLIALIVLLGNLTEFPKQPWWKASSLIVLFHPLADAVLEAIPEDLSKIVDQV